MSAWLSAAEGAARIRAGTLTSSALVGACLERIAEREPVVGAWQFFDPEAALRAAHAADRAPARGALHGVPFGVKDIMDTADMPTGLGFAPYADRRPTWDAACVAACRRAGGIVLGKTVTTEFAFSAPVKTRHPLRPDATPGASSSGSAAAVADGMVPLAFGSQTLSSMIRPAAYCGVVGYKGSHGEYSLSGIRPFAESFDSLGLAARSVEDIALLRDVLLDRDVAGFAPSPSAPRVGVCRTPHWDALGRDVQDAFEAAVAALAAAGAKVENVAVPEAFLPLDDAHRTIMAYEAARNYGYEQDHHQAALSENFRALCDAGRAVTRSALADAHRAMAAAIAQVPPAIGAFDAWISPATRTEAPPAATGMGDPLMSRMWTALRIPSLTLPAGRGATGLPLGVQFLVPSGEDDALLAIGAWAAPALAEV